MPAAECPQREENTENIISNILLNFVTSDLINNFNRIVAPYTHTHTHSHFSRVTLLFISHLYRFHRSQPNQATD